MQAGVEALGRLHATFAQEGELEKLEWLPRGHCRAEHAFFLQHHYSLLQCLSSHALAELLPQGAREAAEQLAWGSFASLLERLAEPPLTLVHGDFKPENLRFSADGQRVAAFDWGACNRGRGVWDFTYFVMLGHPPRERREREQDLLRRYLAAAGKATGEAVNEAWADIKCASLAILAFIIMTRAVCAHGEAKRMLRRNLQWVGEAIVDWHAIGVISER